MGFTDLVAGLTAAAFALLGGIAYSELGVVALAVGATVAVIAPAVVLSFGRRSAAAPEPAG